MPVQKKSLRNSLVFAAVCTAYCLAPAGGWADQSGSGEVKACSADFYAKLRSPVKKDDNTIKVDCNIDLKPGEVIARKLDFAGAEASGTSLDCHGATLGTKASKPSSKSPIIAIRSVKKRKGDGNGDGWSVPQGITIRNCKIVGNLRLIGLGISGEAEEVRKSSLHRNHTENAQANAPSDILISKVTIEATGGIPLYFGPGVTRTTVEKSTLRGKSSKTAVYLDAESANNVLDRNTFAVKTSLREQVAIDGSAKNRITNNRFDDPVRGGIYVYRNCGEGGTIRHQKPQYNEIIGNTFTYDHFRLAAPAIWLNHRDVGKLYCKLNPKYPFGSSLDWHDFAKHNLVKDNRFKGPWSLRIVNFDDTNKITGNK